MKFIILIALILIGCGTEQSTEVISVATPEIEAHVNHLLADFDAHADSYKANVSVNSVRIVWIKNMFANGRCKVGPQLELSLDYFETAISSSNAEIVLFHELGHCLLSRVHTTDQRSLMISDTSKIDPKYYDDHKTEYLNELFNKRGDTHVGTISSN